MQTCSFAKTSPKPKNPRSKWPQFFFTRSRAEKFLQLCAPGGFQLKAMENESSNLRESLWRRKPSDAERAKLHARPELAAEARLTEALAKTTDVPVASNFTARVMDAIEREERLAARTRGWRWSWRFLFPRVAVAAALLVFTGVSVQRYEANSSRHEMIRTVAMVTSDKSAPSVDALKDLEAIERMSQSAHADGELLAALQP